MVPGPPIPRPSRRGPGAVFVPLFVLVTAIIIWTLCSDPADAQEQCAPGLIHYMPFCLTPAEYQALSDPQPTPTLQPAPPAYQYIEGTEQWRSMVAYFWGRHGAEVVNRMLRIMNCESRGRWWIMNEQGSGAEGLFQIMQFWKKQWPGNYKDPWTNAAVAYQIWLEQGWRAWVCRG